MLQFKGIKSIAKCIKDSKASMAIEFAVVASLLFLVIFADIEFCLIMCASSMLEGTILAAAREGSTGYFTGASQSQYLTDMIKSRAGHFLNPNNLSISIPSAADNPGVIVPYTVSYPWPIPMKLLGQIIGNNGSTATYTITATAIVQNENH